MLINCSKTVLQISHALFDGYLALLCTYLAAVFVLGILPELFAGTFPQLGRKKQTRIKTALVLLVCLIILSMAVLSFSLRKKFFALVLRASWEF